MRVAQITYSGFGGLGSVVFSLIEGDKNHKNEWMVGFIGDQPLDSSYPGRCEENGVKYQVFRSTPGKPYRAWFKLIRWLGEVKPQMVICHSPNSILACRIYALFHRAGVILVEHTANHVKSKSQRAASMLGILISDKIVVLTEEYREEVREIYGPLYRSKKVEIIPNGIDSNIYTPASSNSLSSTGVLRFGMAGRYTVTKRQDLLIRVMERLIELRPGLRVELSLAGDGGEIDRVKKQAFDSTAALNIHFEGLLTEREVAPWLRGLDLYVHATDGETLSTSLLQAMATRLPIIASDVSGVTNLLGKEGEYGICLPNNAEAFANGILHLIDNPQLMVSLGLRARSRVLDCYSNDKMFEKYQSFLDPD